MKLYKYIFETGRYKLYNKSIMYKKNNTQISSLENPTDIMQPSLTSVNYLKVLPLLFYK